MGSSGRPKRTAEPPAGSLAAYAVVSAVSTAPGIGTDRSQAGLRRADPIGAGLTKRTSTSRSLRPVARPTPAVIIDVAVCGTAPFHGFVVMAGAARPLGPEVGTQSDTDDGSRKARPLQRRGEALSLGRRKRRRRPRYCSTLQSQIMRSSQSSTRATTDSPAWSIPKGRRRLRIAAPTKF